MTTLRPSPSAHVLIAWVLGVALAACGNSHGGGPVTGGTSTAEGLGGTTPAGGSGGRGGAGGSGGTIPTGAGGSGSGSQTDTGGRPGTGGTPPSTGGTAGVGSGGASATGGQAGGATGGNGQSGGATGTGGRTSGQTGGATGGNGQTGGATGGGGRTSTGGQAGRGTGGSQTGGTTGSQRMISFGTLLDPQAVMSAAQQLAKSLANPSSSKWRAKGDQHRTYRFAEANADEPYRLYVPTDWDGTSELPLVMYLHGSGSDENAYVDMNNKQMITLAQEHGYLLVSPLGDKGAYGNFLRLTAPFGNEGAAASLMAQVTTETERTNELSEKDVINVLELVLAEYPITRAAMFLSGHSMGSGGTWYIGGKYAGYWKGIGPMSGPFVQASGYPWEAVRKIAIFVTEGTQAPSLDASRLLRDWLSTNGFNAEYEEVNADHGGMIKLVLPDVFSFFDRAQGK